MTDSYDFGLPFALGGKFPRHARAMIITDDRLSTNGKYRTLSPESPHIAIGGARAKVTRWNEGRLRNLRHT